MVDHKYDYLKTTGIVRSSIYPPFLGRFFMPSNNSNFQIRFTHVSSPFEMKEAPHKHDSIGVRFCTLYSRFKGVRCRE